MKCLLAPKIGFPFIWKPGKKTNFVCLFFFPLKDLHWTLVSNDLGLRSRRFTIRQLEPLTAYELKIKANR